MDTTLGKRIMAERKKLGLTQDKLAETLGVTAQAVSKWENDQSCPDITMLPRLSELFGITVDELLGVAKTEATQTAVLEGTVEDSNADEDGHGFEFNFEPGRRDGIFIALFILLVGALTLVSVLFNLGVSFWSILWPSALLIYGLAHLLPRFSVFSLGCALFGGYYLIRNLGIWEFTIAGELIFPIAVVLFGVGLLVDALRKPRKPRFSISRNGVKLSSDDGSKKTESHFSSEEDSFDCSLSFGEKTQYVQLSCLRYGDISCSFGELTVDLSGCEEIGDGCRINATCSFGQLNLLVPRKYRVHADSHTAFAGLSFEGQPDSTPQGIIELEASVNFGETQVQYI